MVVLIVLVLLLIIVGVVSSLVTPRHYRGELESMNQNQVSNEAPAPLPVPPPPPRTAHMQQVLDNSKGFQYFVSYTDNGFEPAELTVKRGETVRFTNNSSRNMWLMSSGGDGGVYPASDSSCGQSAFDTCVAYPPNEIWEFTFDVAGTWVFRNNVHKDDVGIIRVK